ncbi:DUF2069 domain-containing protein [Niveibacterium sp. SC-1]|uniref:DUF2069 domain-containing protein n=1 Tax=Niveibacterium sp. SC-1 TaxID=3135646 RepID=UPI00311F8458
MLLFALIALGMTWELWLAPVRPGGSWLVLKVIPLLFAVRGMRRGDRYTFQWMSLLVWLYFTEGVVRGASDNGISAALGWIEAILSVALFVCVAMYSRMTAPSRRTQPPQED